ncbi:hypothetical protein SAMN02910453_1523 [Lachnospiraceae bacterium A10]|nr:hypothetical protein SAMN02910453_1523 [Lachnospiraceae bacterium A10]
MRRRTKRVLLLLIFMVVILIVTIVVTSYLKKRDDIELQKIESDKSLSVEPYNYPEEFEIGEELEGAIVTLALSYDEFDDTVVHGEEWETNFIRIFLQNSHYIPEYAMENASENGGVLTKEQAEYIQYSLTGQDVELNSVKDGVNIYDDAAETLGDGSISSYEVKEESDDIVIVDAVLKTENGAGSNTNNVEIVLSKNEYSCFDGYSINSISITHEVLSPNSNSSNEGNATVHSFVGSDLGFDNDGIFTFEYSFSNDTDDSMYGKYVQVDLSENAELAEYVRSHSGENMLVTYTMDGSEENVDTVVPDSITLN